MADATGRALTLVSKAATPTTAQGQFAARVQQCLQTHGDIAAEAIWQEMARLIAQDWLVLSKDQQPKDTWTMLSKCTETVLRIRKVSRGQRTDGQKDLEEFRDFMRGVLNVDEEE